MIHRRHLTGAALFLAVAGFVAACTEDVPTAPGSKTPQSPEGINRSATLVALRCDGVVATREIVCGSPSAPPGSLVRSPATRQDIILGKQNVTVTLTSSNVNYNSGTQAFTFDVTVRNLIPQPLGTSDTTGALAPDANGVRVFFGQGPTVTSGTGTITVVADGTATFFAPNQPYYQYNTVLEQFEVSSPRTWQLNMPPTVLTFSFLVFVWAEVPRPDGYIDMSVGTGNSIGSIEDRQITYVVRNADGTIASTFDPITFSSSDAFLGTVDPSTGLITPNRAGNIVITAVSGLRVGHMVVTIRPTRRYWTGAAGTTEWTTGANWGPRQIEPQPTDTAVVTDTLPVAGTPYPALSSNQSIGGVEVLDITPGGTIPTIALQAFNLDASGDVLTTNSANINNTSGVLILSGIARTVAGTLPPIRVTGTYSLIGNVTARAPIRVDLGRLTNTSFRLQATSF